MKQHYFSYVLLPFALAASIFISLRAHAEIADLRSSSREIRFALVDHGHALNLAQRKSVRRNLALSYMTLEKLAVKRGAPVPPAGRSLISLSVALERLIEATPTRQLSPASQSQLQRQLARASSVLESKVE